jgi:chromosome partitioning protein
MPIHRLMPLQVWVLSQKNIRNIYDCLINEADPKDVILTTANPNLDLLPSHIDLVGAELELINMPNREKC